MILLNVPVVELTDNCDHNAISFKMWCPSSCNNNCNIKYNLYYTDFGSFSNYLPSIDENTVFFNYNILLINAGLISKPYLKISTFVPKYIEKSKSKTYPPYICKVLIKKRNCFGENVDSQVTKTFIVNKKPNVAI